MPITRNDSSITWHTVLRSKTAIVVECVLLVLIAGAVTKQLVHKHQVEQEISQLQQRIESLRDKNAELGGLIEYLDSDAYKEEQARLKLGLQLPGESVVSVLGVTTDSGNVATAGNGTHAPTETPPTSNPQRWLNYFF